MLLPGDKAFLLFCMLSLLSLCVTTYAFSPTSISFPKTFKSSKIALTPVRTTRDNEIHDDNGSCKDKQQLLWSSRRLVLSSLSLLGTSCVLASLAPSFPPAMAKEIETERVDDFASIAARASKISRELQSSTPTSAIQKTDNTMYDFSLPVEGENRPVMEIIHQQESGKDAKVKAVLVVNIKQDDPIARKNIPELISLVTKYGGKGEFVVLCSPTDQGYFEPDTSTLIRLKLASEYGYGINPASIVTDKVNLLGTGAHPFWRWLEGTCRTPAGLGKVQGNFEKFLLDGRTGLPLRRYPRKYMPLDIRDDIEAVLANRPLPPPGANFAEEWRAAAAEAERDTYRFEKGLNVFDQ